MLFVLIFVVLAAISTGAIMVVLRPGADQQALHRRLALLLATGPQVIVPDKLVLRQPAAGSGTRNWVDRLLESVGLLHSLNRLLLQAHVTTTAKKLFFSMLSMAGIGGLCAFAFSRSALIAVPVALVLAYVPLLRLNFIRSKRIKAFEKALPDCIEMCARSLRAGHSLPGAIGQVADESEQPAKDEFAEVFRRQNYGLPLRDALLEMLERVPSADLRVVVTGILVQKDTGGNLAEIMDRVSEVIRERVRIKGEIGVHTAQGRLTGYILCALPVFLLFAINVVSPGYSKLLFHEDIGQKLLLTGVGLLALGWFLIRKIINGIEV